MRVPFRLVDVFTDRPLTGNQLCVVPEPIDLGDATMQAIAAEIGFSETTFVTRVEGDRYWLRIFTPITELPFAGHPTLGTAFVLVSEGIVGTPTVQIVAAGEIPVEVDVMARTARMRQLPPIFEPAMDHRKLAAEAIGLQEADLDPGVPVQIVSTGVPQLLVSLSDSEAVSRAHPVLDRLRELLAGTGADSVYLFHASGATATARLLIADPVHTEDAATGSAAGPLGAYLAEHGRLRPGRLTVTQGVEMGRPSTLLVDVAGAEGAWVVDVSGGVAKVGGGAFDIPGPA
jgi:trans-2,3-dihydro-3-hydroxyanthranilate isomerase